MVTHLLSPPEEGFIDKYRSGRLTDADDFIAGAAGAPIFTCTSGGSTTTMVGSAANLTTSLNVARIGERFTLFDSTGKLKENTVFQVTAHNGTTTLTFTPAAAGATANGDFAKLVSGDPFTDNGSLDQRLLALGGVFTQAYVDHMTQNDKVYAVRQAENADAVK